MAKSDKPNILFVIAGDIAARQPQMIDTGMAHIGFRCVVRSTGMREP